jgi:chromosome segregation ATPase
VVSNVQQEEDYEKRFKGLQKLFDKQQKELNDLKQEHASTVEGREAILQAQRQAQTDYEKTKADLDVLNAEKTTLTSQLTAQEARAQRASLILAEFSDLAAFEAKGLLPAATTEEEMRTKFTSFREAVGTTVNKTVQEKLLNASPSPTGLTTITTTRSKEDVYAELTRLAGSRKPEDRQKREDLIREWDELNKQS